MGQKITTNLNCDVFLLLICYVMSMTMKRAEEHDVCRKLKLFNHVLETKNVSKTHRYRCVS
jgi:hypothetical protein